MTDPVLQRQMERWYPLIPHPQQIALDRAVDDGIRFPLVPAGRRCLAAGTHVATPYGPRAIESLRVGDLVLGYEEGEIRPTYVTATHDNGVQDTHDVIAYNRFTLCAATPTHKLLTLRRWSGSYKTLPITEITENMKVVRQFADELIVGGDENEPQAYAIGLSDLAEFDPKITIECVDNWNRESAFRLLSGVIDKYANLRSRNAKLPRLELEIKRPKDKILSIVSFLIYKYFQDKAEVTFKRGRYVILIAKNQLIFRLRDALRPYSRALDELDTGSITIRDSELRQLPIRLSESTTRVHTHDITVANSTNLYCLHYGGIVTSNSGKTERLKRFVARQAMANPNEKYFLAAPTNAQATKIFWDDMKALTLSCRHLKKPSESDKKIFLPNGSEIHIIGLDAPKRIEGINWTGGGIDEIADVKQTAMEANVMPALDTVNPMRPYHRAWCWFTGVPDGLNHYYDMCMIAESGKNPDFKVFHWKSSEILPADVIESAKRRMSLKQFKQEYEASFETAGGRIYEDYSKENYTTAEIMPHEALHWTHDQNYTPLSSAVAVLRRGVPYFLDEIVLESAVSRQSAYEFVDKFRTHQNKTVYLYGDPAGRAGEKHGHKSDYTEIMHVLTLAGWEVVKRVKSSHPSIRNRQNAVRRMIKNASGEVSLFVNPNKAVYCHKGLATVQFKEGSSFQEDQRNPHQHITTAIGYFVDWHWPMGVIETTEGLTVGMH